MLFSIFQGVYLIQSTKETKMQKSKQNQEINDAEREKYQAVAKLRKEMDYKITETQANLIDLNNEQLHTTTRLTILQNH